MLNSNSINVSIILVIYKLNIPEILMVGYFDKTLLFDRSSIGKSPLYVNKNDPKYITSQIPTLILRIYSYAF